MVQIKWTNVLQNKEQIVFKYFSLKNASSQQMQAYWNSCGWLISYNETINFAHLQVVLKSDSLNQTDPAESVYLSTRYLAIQSIVFYFESL